MRSSTLSLATMALAASKLVAGQTYTDCNPTTNSSCPSDPALGKTITTDFTAGEEAVLADYTYATGTSLTYDSTLGGGFVVNTTTSAPTITSNKYIFFGKVDVVMRASSGTGIVSSFVLQSDDLDEIDWEFLGSVDASVQTNFFGKGNTTTYDREMSVASSNVVEDFHTYTIIWTAESIQWQVDGTTLRTLQYSDPTAVYGKNYPQTPMRIKMGNWIGCADAAAAAAAATKGTCEWAQGYPDWSTAPFTQYVKSVTIQDYGCAESYSYGDMTGDYSSIVSTGSCSNSTSSSSSTASSKDSKATASVSSSSSSSSSSSGGVFAESSTSSGSSKATATSSSTATGSAAAKSSSSATTSSGTAKATTNAALGMKPKHQYGVLDFAVMALGLGLGYLVM